MNDFGTVFSFEFRRYLHSKVYIAITLLLVVAAALVFCWPRFFGGSDEPGGPSGGTANEPAAFILLRNDSPMDTERLVSTLNTGGLSVELIADTEESALRARLDDESTDGILIVNADQTVRYLVRTVGLFDEQGAMLSGLLTSAMQTEKALALGLDPGQAASVLTTTAILDVEPVGKDQNQNFLLAYILFFLLYMAIMLYGQLVASAVAGEKSNRSMELLITSTSTRSMIFGKVFASSLAGFLQLFAILASMTVFYHVNADLWSGNAFISAAFAGSLELTLWALLFFIGGFLLYAFLFAAVGSLVSRMEDLNTASTPVLFLFIIAFIVSMISFASGHVNTPLMVVCSYVPFTAPLAMFARIAIGEVQGIEIVVSVVILALSVWGAGRLSSGIYRLGVLMYGQPPKLGAVLKALRSNHV